MRTVFTIISNVIGTLNITSTANYFKEFVIANIVEEPSRYVATEYNITTNSIYCVMFGTGKGDIIRVFPDDTTDYYKQNIRIGNKTYEFSDTDTYYLQAESDTTYTQRLLTDDSVVFTAHCGKYEDIPEDVKELLVDFEPKNNIFSWAYRPEGLIVSFVE
jgi:hypothetical protein